MHWKLKAHIQNAISLLPDAASYGAYYWVQRRFGALRHVEPTNAFSAAVNIWKRIQRQDRQPANKVFFEVGTGRAPLVPIGYWLMGAQEIFSFDLNPYLKKELIAEHLRYIVQNTDEILMLFGSLINKARLDSLKRLGDKPDFSIAELLDLCRITYVAPGDASDTKLPSQHIDFHTSYTVLEHIPESVLEDIFKEGNRIIKNDGLFVHYIDYSDHFSHSDDSITAINFLQYSDREWEKYAANRYMFMNRLRHDDFLALYETVGHRIVEAETEIDTRSENVLNTNSLMLSDRFSSKPKEVLAITGVWTLTKYDL